MQQLKICHINIIMNVPNAQTTFKLVETLARTWKRNVGDFFSLSGRWTKSPGGISKPLKCKVAEKKLQTLVVASVSKMFPGDMLRALKQLIIRVQEFISRRNNFPSLSFRWFLRNDVRSFVFSGPRLSLNLRRAAGDGGGSETDVCKWKFNISESFYGNHFPRNR